MSLMFKNIVGANGDDGGQQQQQRTPVEDADSLQSRAMITLVDLLGEGVIGGLVDGARSIYFNDTALEKADGTRNFQGVTWEQRTGLQDQQMLSGVDDVEFPTTVNVQVRKDIPVPITITNQNVDQVRLIVAVPALMAQDINTGDVHGTSIEYKFEISANGCPFVPLGDTLTISGKTRSRYQRAHVFDLPNLDLPTVVWTIRLVRITADSSTSSVANDLWFDSYAEITKTKLSYPNSALIGISIDSSQFGSIPSRSYLVDGIFIKIPSNYDSSSNTYVGVWDGTFKMAISSNPAWVLYDLVLATRYGLGQHVMPAMINKAKLYQIGKYCDETVPNGLGGFEKRFSINTVIQTLEQAYKVISDLTSAFRGMSYWNGGMTCFTQDAPTEPSMIFEPANVIDGVFTYSGSSRKDRHSVVLVTWNDPTNRYKQSIEYIDDPELVAKYGIRKLEVVAFGCTSRTQAHRVGRWILYTEKYESNIITFKVGLDGSMVLPGEIVKIHDTSRAGKRAAGRLINATLTSASLDAPVTLDQAGATISIRLSDGTFADRTVNEAAGVHSTVTWVTPLPTLPVSNAIWLISETSLEPMLARVTGITQGDKLSEFTITTVEHYPGKFALIENGIALPTSTTSILTGVPKTPTNLSLLDHIYLSGSSILTMLDISWEDNQAGLVGWDVQVRERTGNWKTYRSNVNSLEIPNVRDGDIYDVRVAAVNLLSRSSNISETVSRIIVGKASAPSDVTGLQVSAKKRGLVLRWNKAPDIDLDVYELREGSSWDNGVVKASTKSDFIDLGVIPIGTYTWRIKALDTTGHYSVNEAVLNTDIGAPPAPTVEYVHSGTDITLNWSVETAYFEISHYVITDSANHISTTLSGKSLRIPITWIGDRIFYVVAVDIAGNAGAAGQRVVTVTAPEEITTVRYTIIGTKIQLSWETPASMLPIAEYDIRFGITWGNGIPVAKVSANSYRVPIDWVGERRFLVNAIDVNGNSGADGRCTITVAAPAAPVVEAKVLLDTFNLSWNTPASTLPIQTYEIRYGSSWSNSTLVGTSNTNTLTVKGSWAYDRTFWVAAIDVNNVTGAAGHVVARIEPPQAPTNFRAQVVDNNVLLYWDQVKGTMPTVSYELRRGANWNTASLIGQKSGGFTTVFETLSGDFIYSIAAVDSAGNYGTPTQKTVKVSQPPDYVLQLNVDSEFNGLASSLYKDGEASIIGPVKYPLETYEQHFVNHGWDSPDAQIRAGYDVVTGQPITAGYPMFAQPGSGITATYEEVIDYGTVLDGTKVTVTLDYEVLGGSINPICQILGSTHPTDNFVDYGLGWQLFLSNFRYVKVKLTFPANSPSDLIKINGLNIRMSAKPLTINRSLDCSENHSDGTMLYLTSDGTETGTPIFVDVTSVQVTPSGTMPIIAIYNFVDTPYPTHLQVLLFDTTGERASGKVSITIRGI